MEKYEYYIKLDEMLSKAKDIKKEIEASTDAEKINYLRLALESKYEEVRKLMETYNKSNKG